MLYISNNISTLLNVNSHNLFYCKNSLYCMFGVSALTNAD